MPYVATVHQKVTKERDYFQDPPVGKDTTGTRHKVVLLDVLIYFIGGRSGMQNELCSSVHIGSVT